MQSAPSTDETTVDTNEHDGSHSLRVLLVYQDKITSTRATLTNHSPFKPEPIHSMNTLTVTRHGPGSPASARRCPHPPGRESFLFAGRVGATFPALGHQRMSRCLIERTHTLLNLPKFGREWQAEKLGQPILCLCLSIFLSKEGTKDIPSARWMC